MPDENTLPGYLELVKNQQQIQVGDKVNALLFPSREVIGVVEKIDGHLVKIKDEGWTVKAMCVKL
jgi:hypothetical protein